MGSNVGTGSAAAQRPGVGWDSEARAETAESPAAAGEARGQGPAEQPARLRPRHPMLAADLLLEGLQRIDAGQADRPMMHEHGLSPSVSSKDGFCSRSR